MSLSFLIVDDSPAMRKFIRRALQFSGLEIGECLEAGSGKQALEVLREQLVEVILTDINMPEMNGEEFVRQVEADEKLRRIPVIVVSTDGSEGRVRQMVSFGAKGYVIKPFAPEAIRSEVERVLEGKNVCSIH